MEATQQPQTDPNVMTVQEIHGMCDRLSPKQIRRFLREAGYSAPPTGLTGMNPKTKYVMDKNDPHFQETLTSLLEFDKNPKDPTRVTRNNRLERGEE